MARFCTKCGRPLKEGEVCNCIAQNTGGAQNSGASQGQPGGRQNYQQGQPGGQQYYQQGQPGGMTKEAEWLNKKKDVIMAGTKNMFTEILPVFKTPVSRVRQISASNSAAVGIEFIVAKAIISFIFTLIVLLVIQGRIDNLAALDSSMSEVPFEVPILPGVLAVLLLTAGMDFLEAVILKAITGAFNGNTNINTMLNVIGARGVFDTVIFVVGMILMLLSFKVALIIILLLQPISVYIEFAIYQGCVDLNENKKPYVYFIAKLCLVVITLIIAYVCFKDMFDLYFGMIDFVDQLLKGNEGAAMRILQDLSETAGNIFGSW